MPRYFFNLYNDIDSMDDEGRDLPDVDSARRAATDDARYMAAESVRHGRLDLRHYVEVVDEAGDPQLVVTFGQAVTVMGQHSNDEPT